jgi:hypothetical protein
MSHYSDVVASGAEGQANLNLWMQDISPWCPGVHRTVMKRQLILAVREFFEQSWAWRQEQGPITLVTDQVTYMLSPFNSTTDVVGVIAVWVNRVPLAPLACAPPPYGHSPEPVPEPVPDQDGDRHHSDRPGGYWCPRPDIIAVYPTPKITTTPQHLTVLCALRPKMSVTQVPKIAVTDFYEAIMNGALYRLLNQPAKPYSNPTLAAYFENKFRKDIGVYAGKAKKGFNNAASWSFPYFGSARHTGMGGIGGGGRHW